MKITKQVALDLAEELRSARDVLKSSHEYAATNKTLVELTLSENRALCSILKRASEALIALSQDEGRDVVKELVACRERIAVLERALARILEADAQVIRVSDTEPRRRLWRAIDAARALFDAAREAFDKGGAW